MDYSQETQNLIDRMCRNVERADFELDKKNAEECLLKTYDLFKLKRPQKIVWFKNIFSTKWGDVARSAESAWSAGSALDYDFNWYIFEFEYCQNPDKDRLPNKNDRRYLEYCELLMKAKEYGLGYRIEFKDILYLVPTPLVRLDKQNRYHSELGQSLWWKDGKKFYYLHGVNFPEDLYYKVISGDMPMAEILKIKDIDQRTQAIKYAKDGLRDFYLKQGGKKIDEIDKLDYKKRPVHYELWKIPKGEIFNREVAFVIYDCPSSIERGERREYSKGVPVEFDKVGEAMAWGMSGDKEEGKMTEKEWQELVPLLNES